MRTSVFVITVFMLLATGCKPNASKGKTRELPIPEILVNYPSEQEVVYSYEYPAFLEAEQTVNLIARVPGFLEKMQYTPGQAVNQGDVLFIIEPKPYIDQVNTAKAGVKSAEAKLAYAQASYERMKEAVNNKAVSEIDFIQAESDYNAAIAGLSDAQAQLNSAEINLGYCYVKAPFNGRVSRNQTDLGNFVGSPSQPSILATIYRDQRMYAYFSMAYAEYQNLPHQSANPKDSLNYIIVTDANKPERQWTGQLNYSAPNVDLQTGTVDVRARIENPKQELISGMYVTIRVPYRKVPHALLIPETSIGTNQIGCFVYLVDKDKNIELRPVKVGALEPNGMRQIVDGVSPEDQYVVEALMSVRPGMKVNPMTPAQMAGLKK